MDLRVPAPATYSCGLERPLGFPGNPESVECPFHSDHWGLIPAAPACAIGFAVICRTPNPSCLLSPWKVQSPTGHCQPGPGTILRASIPSFKSSIKWGSFRLIQVHLSLIQIPWKAAWIGAHRPDEVISCCMAVLNPKFLT